MHYLVLYSVNWKKNTKTVPSTSNTLLSHLIGNLLPSMKVEYRGTVFKLVFKTFSSWQHRVLCNQTHDCRRTWKRGPKRRDLSWFYCITLVSSCSSTSNHQSWSLTAAKNTSWCFAWIRQTLNFSEFQHSSNKLNSLFTHTDNIISS